MRTLKIQSSTDKCVFRSRQSNVRQLLPASDHCRARGNQIAMHSSDNETVLGRSLKLGGAAKHLMFEIIKERSPAYLRIYLASVVQSTT